MGTKRRLEQGVIVGALSEPSCNVFRVVRETHAGSHKVGKSSKELSASRRTPLNVLLMDDISLAEFVLDKESLSVIVKDD